MRIPREVRNFVGFSLWVGLAMIFFVAATTFVNRRFSQGALSPLGNAAGWAERSATGR